jgi:sulfur carrier protein
MKIKVNGDPVEIEAGSVMAALAQLGYGDAKVATAVNGVFVPAGQRDDTALGAGDALEIVAPRQGG